MAASGTSRAQANRAIRQEALREQLESQGHVQHVIEIATKLSDLDEELDSVKVQRLRAAADIKLKLIAKYLPDTKQLELSGPGGGAIETSSSINFIPVNNKTK